MALLAVACAAPVTVALGQAPGRAAFLTVDSSRIYYEECGRGEAIMLLHDGLVHSATWDRVWPQLCERYHVLRYDRRGMGRSQPPTIPFIPTEDLLALLDDRHLQRATLVGSSSGTGLAIDFAIRHPDRVSRLVLIGPVVHGMASSRHFLDRGARNNEPLARGDVRAAARNWADDRYQIAGADTAAREELFRDLVANPRNLTYTGNLELRFAVPAAARMGELRVPTLILVGEWDIPDVQAYAGAVELGIWGSLREVVPGAGHLVQLQKPEWLTRRIDQFVSSTPIVVVSADRLQQLAGTYSPFLFGRAGDFLVRDGRLFAHTATERELPLFPSSDTTFYALAWGGARFTFHRDSTGRGARVDVSAFGEATHTAVVTQVLPPPPRR